MKQREPLDTSFLESGSEGLESSRVEPPPPEDSRQVDDQNLDVAVDTLDVNETQDAGLGHRVDTVNDENTTAAA